MEEIDMFQEDLVDEPKNKPTELCYDEMQIAYWNLTKLPNMPFEHRKGMPYSNENVLLVLNIALENNYRVMFQPAKQRRKKILTLWISYNDVKNKMPNLK